VAGLPDSIFSNQKYQFGKILECLAMKEAGKFYDRLVTLTAICYILWPLGIFCGYSGIFLQFWYVVPRKIWQPWSVVVPMAWPLVKGLFTQNMNLAL
jgi:hypothetical protein